jgi:O-antigen/teichoic acid export membrane protein
MDNIKLISYGIATSILLAFIFIYVYRHRKSPDQSDCLNLALNTVGLSLIVALAIKLSGTTPVNLGDLKDSTDSIYAGILGMTLLGVHQIVKSFQSAWNKEERKPKIPDDQR